MINICQFWRKTYFENFSGESRAFSEERQGCRMEVMIIIMMVFLMMMIMMVVLTMIMMVFLVMIIVVTLVTDQWSG